MNINCSTEYCSTASTETNNTSEESSDTQLFGAGKSEGEALSGGHPAHLPLKKRISPRPPMLFATRRRGTLLMNAIVAVARVNLVHQEAVAKPKVVHFSCLYR